MLEMRTKCECCNKTLTIHSNDAMICSYECTYCMDCVENELKHICPSCGGGFEKRPTRFEKRSKDLTKSDLNKKL